MTNGLVNGMESQFGMIISSILSIFPQLVTHFSPPEALGLGRSAYVPPHLRNVQRAASNPSLSDA